MAIITAILWGLSAFCALMTLNDIKAGREDVASGAMTTGFMVISAYLLGGLPNAI